MFKNHFLIALRSMLKNKLYIFINIFGMGISIACCIVAYYNYQFNQEFDDNHVNASTVYRVNSVREFQNNLTTFGYVPIGLGNAVKENIKDVDNVIRYSPSGGNFRTKEEVFSEGIVFVDPAFFDVFTFEFKEGSGNALSDKSAIVISEDVAKKYFGEESALGMMITQLLDSGRMREFVVGGVFTNPKINSSFSFQGMYSTYENEFLDPVSEYNENSWKYRNTLFVQIKNKDRVSSIQDQMSSYVDNNNKIREDFIIKKFALESFVGMGVRDEYNSVEGTWTREGSPLAAIVGTGMMGILILLIACFNLTNTSIAISSRRLKEIGIRKVMGSERRQLIGQFMGETAFVCFVSLIIGVVIAETFLIPAFNNMWDGMTLTTDYFGDLDFTFFTILTLAFTALLAGSYPSFYISKFQSITILKGKAKFGGTNFFTLFLLMMQFAISLIGIVCSIAFVENARYQREFDLGFNKSGVVFTSVANRSEYEVYRNVLANNEDITGITGTQHHFFANYYIDPIKSGDQEIEVDILNVGDNYIETAGLTILQGRDFKLDSETDRKESVIVSEELVRKFGWQEPIGKEIVWMDTVKLYVVGVVKDIYTSGMWDPLDPTMLRYADKDQVNFVLVQAPSDKIVDVNKYMETKWKEIFPNKMYRGRFMDAQVVEATNVNNNIVKMFVFLGVIALLLSATGLFTLVSLNIIKKMKEIGVRKVLGASITNISRIINTKFAIILLVSCVLGAAGGYYLSAMLMSSIWNYYLKASIMTMLISSGIMLAFSFLSIAFKTYNTASMNPVTVLRDE